MGKLCTAAINPATKMLMYDNYTFLDGEWSSLVASVVEFKLKKKHLSIDLASGSNNKPLVVTLPLITRCTLYLGYYLCLDLTEGYYAGLRTTRPPSGFPQKALATTITHTASAATTLAEHTRSTLAHSRTSPSSSLPHHHYHQCAPVKSVVSESALVAESRRLSFVFRGLSCALIRAGRRTDRGERRRFCIG